MATPIQQPSDLAEIQRIHDWIDKRSAPGQPCDNCLSLLTASECSQVATAQTNLGLLVFVVCESCSRAKGPHVENRFVSQEIINFLKSHVASGAGAQ